MLSHKEYTKCTVLKFDFGINMILEDILLKQGRKQVKVIEERKL